MASFINNLVIPSQTKKKQLFSAGIFHEKTSEEYKKAVEKTSDAIVNFLKCRNSASTGVEFSDIKEKIESVGLDDEQTILSLKDSLLELNEIYFKDATAFHHTNYMAHLNCPVLIPTLAAEMIISSLNTSMDTWDQSIGATLIEMKLISWTLKEIGYRDMSDGIFTSGGTQSNLMGLLLARNHFMIENYGIDPMKKGLPFEGKKFKVFCSACAHFSIKRNAGILGLGQDSVIEVPVDEQYRMNPEALEDSIIKELDFGNTPIAVVSTAGTTDFGSIDPLKQLAKVAKRYKLWNHVDASYGGGLILSDKHKHKLQDIYLSDSVTIDYHKTFFQPISSSVFLVKNEKNLKSIAYYADYLNPKDMEEEGEPNMVRKSLQTTRRFDALKLWISLRTLGKEILGQYLDRIIDLTEQTSSLLWENPCFHILNKPEISAIVFRYVPIGVNQKKLCKLNKIIKKKLFDLHGIAIASTKVNGYFYLKFTLLNPLMSIKGIFNIIHCIESVGQESKNKLQLSNENRDYYSNTEE